MKQGLRHTAVLWACAACCCACMDYGPLEEEPFANPQRGVFITSEGNFGWDNASLSFYDPAARKVENEIFIRANGMKLGDVAQSMALHGGRGYVVVNNSGAVYVIDPATFRVTGLIEGVVSPRYIHFPNDTTAYITDLYDPRITVIDTRTNRIRNRIPTNGHKSTEQMVQWNDEVFVNCWSYDDKILVVDAAREQLVDSIQVGPQPSSLAIDRNGKIWTVTDGRTAGVPAALYRIDAASRRIEQTFAFPPGDHPSSVTLNGTRDTLYFINRDVWRMRIDATSLPATPFLPYTETIYYEVAVDPYTSEVYVADAIDYVQHGVVYRFTARGAAVDTLRVGVTPGGFCFKP
ncbi:YncE family protein [uncultured Alistipes sp.]|uniref:YncE family protein n=1 Tax=Alistipes sp. TaxID=1872444 RepID=UPI002625F9F9|nr:YncE family protein [uncultured Alistipes sp.]